MGPKPAKTTEHRTRATKLAHLKAQKTINQLRNWAEANDDEEEAETLKKRESRATKNKAKAQDATLDDSDQTDHSPTSPLTMIDDVYFHRASHKVVVLVPSDESRLSPECTLRIGTNYLTDIACQTVLVASKAELRSFYAPSFCLTHSSPSSNSPPPPLLVHGLTFKPIHPR
jgi:hypothetical protein